MFVAEYDKSGQPQNYCSNLKLVISGTKFEFYKFSHPNMYGRRVSKSDDKEKVKITMNEEEKIQASARRAKRNIRRLICANAWKWFDMNDKPYLPITLTLTFSDDIRDIEKANALFSKFIQRLNYSVNRHERSQGLDHSKKNFLKYTAVIEFQDKTRGGVIHYHMIFYNLPKMSKIYDRLIKIWGQGYFWVGSKKAGGKFKGVMDNKRLDKVVEYFTKYLAKGFQDKRLASKKKYFNSRGLLKPVDVFIEELVYMIEKNMPEEALDYEAQNLTYKYKLGERSFDYKRYDLSDYPEVLKEALELANMY